MVGYSAAVDNASPAAPAGVANLAVGIPTVESCFAGSKAAVENCVCRSRWVP